MLRFLKWFLASAMLLVLTACGGGGGTQDDGNQSVTSTSTLPKKTGQTKSYDESGTEVLDNSIKDDGFYQAGITASYTRDDATNIVTDHITNLQWQDDANASTILKPWVTTANYNDGNYTDTSGDTATTYCAT